MKKKYYYYYIYDFGISAPPQPPIIDSQMSWFV